MPDQIEQHKFWIDPKERVEYYLNHQTSFKINLQQLQELKERDVWTRKEVRYMSYADYKGSWKHWYCKNLMHLPGFREIQSLPFLEEYRDLHSLIDFLLPFDLNDNSIEDFKFPIFYGEHGDTGNIPLIGKARKIHDKFRVLYELRSLRFNVPCFKVDKNDRNWSAKKDDVSWRGATTGEEIREKFVKNYYSLYNIGFSDVKQKPHLAAFIRHRMSIKEQLKYKFLVSLQGNDTASNIRWILHSNSVPIMPKPVWTSWMMEEKLLPNVHYLQLNDDLSNLEELLEWAREHDNECKEMAQNGRDFVAQFLDKNYDAYVKMLLLEEYSKRLQII